MTKPVKFTLTDPAHLLALGFGSGLLKPAPGTWGTLAAVPFYWFAMTWLPASLAAQFGFIAITFLVGVYVCGKAAADVGAHDHGSIVWDEFVGLFVTLIAVPLTWQNVVIGFILFRLFDIVKPWPIRLLDKHVHGGFGIMIDDVLAGLFAGVIVFLAQPFIPF